MRLYLTRGSPLMRRSDRLEAAGFWVAVVLVVASLWPAVLVAGLVADQERANRALRHQVEATLLEDAVPVTLSFGEFAEQRADATARWTTPAGAETTGRIAVPRPAAAGTTTTIWVDQDGRPAAPPLDEAGAGIRAVHAGASVVALSGAVVLFCMLGWRWLLNRQRYAEWDLAWEKADTRRTP